MQVFFSTPHGDFAIDPIEASLTLQQICLQNRIPFQSVSFYGKSEDELRLIVGMDQTLASLTSSFEEIHIKIDRNVDYFHLLNKERKTKPSPHPVSEYVFSSASGKEELHLELSQTDCKRFVQENVFRFLKEEISLHPHRKIILGISGGGDSNTLIEAFLASGLVNKEQLLAVMMLGIPDWDKGQPRAQALCDTHGIALEFVSAEQVAELLGMPRNTDWVEEFVRYFPEIDLEGLGTHCLYLTFRHLVQKTKAQAVVTGLNLEDLLAECLYCTMQGKLPPPFPVRVVEQTPFWYPLYNIPKKILDGCYPKYALQNYQDRLPSILMGRAIPYYISQYLHCLVPGIEFDLLKGFKQVAKLNQNYGHFDPELGFTTVDRLTPETRRKWKQFIEQGDR